MIKGYISFTLYLDMKFKFSYTGICVRDLDRSVKFYTEVLDMKLLNRFEIPETRGEIATLKSEDGEQLLELNYYRDKGEYVNGDEVDHLAFEVKNVDEAFKWLREKGIEATLEPFDEGGIRLAFVKDPDGIWIELHPPIE